MRRLPELAAVGAGITLLVTALVWRAASRYRSRRQLIAMMTADDPAVRRAAVDFLGDGGLMPYASVLVTRTKVEQEPSVLHALATLIARNQWEPADHRKLVELRLWARRQLSETHAGVETSPTTPPEAPPSQSRRSAVSMSAPMSQLVRRLEASLGEPVVCLRLEDADGNIEGFLA